MLAPELIIRFAMLYELVPPRASSPALLIVALFITVIRLSELDTLAFSIVMLSRVAGASSVVSRRV